MKFTFSLALLSLLHFLPDAVRADGAPEAKLLTSCISGKSDDLAVVDVAQALAAGANINVIDKRSGQTPLMAAILRGKEKTTRFLLDKGADVTIAEAQGYTPAHGAAFGGFVEILKLLKEHGINIMSDEHGDGYLPFHRACWGKDAGHAAVVEYLLREGMDPDLEAKNGERCIEMTQNEKTHQVLVDFGAEPGRDDDEYDEEDEL